MSIIKLDSNGIDQWTKTVGDITYDYGNSVVQDIDGGFSIAGCRGNDLYIIKLDSNGNSCGNQGTGGISGSGGILGMGGGVVGSGGIVGSGGTMTWICPCLSTFSTISPVVCNNYILPSGNDTLTVTGNYFDTIPNTSGCDSVISINLTVNYSYFIQNQFFICNGDSIFLFGNWQKVSGLFYDSTLAVNGCDSIIETNLTVLSDTLKSQSFSICDGDSIFIGGNWQKLTGIYYDTTTAINGCDSIIETKLVINLISSIQNQLSICTGDSVFLSGSYQTTPGNYYDTLISVGGCDSIVISTLSILPNSVFNQTNSICSGDSIFIGGNWQKLNGTYFDTLTASNSCDSIITSSLTVFPLPDSANASPEEVAIYIDEDTILNAIANAATTILWSPSDYLSCISCSNPIANPNQTTTYYLTVTSSNGCSVTDSVLIIDIFPK